MALNKRWWWAVPILLVLIFNLWNPVGYVGGGADDDRYLTAARCWLAQGPCLPSNHWEGRWPVIAPLTVAIGLFGINRFSVGISALLASLACLFLLKWIGDRQFKQPAGLAAALIYGVLPAFAIQTLSATVEPIELMFILGCFALLTLERPLLAGISLGLAFQTRETSIAALLPALFLIRREPMQLVRFMVGFALPLGAELLVYLVNTGHPLYRRTLSMEHTLIPSSELRTLDRGLPFFNSNLMDNWKYEPGVEIHWLVDGFANLLVNIKTGFLFALTPLFYFLYRRKLYEREAKVAVFVMASSFFYAAVLIYGLSIDPKPRMMYVPLAGLSMVLGLVAVRAWNIVIATTFIALVPILAICLDAQPRHSHWENAAKRINGKYYGMIETSQSGYFQLDPQLRDLPTVGSGKQYLLFVKSTPCRIPADEDPFDLSRASVVEEVGSTSMARMFDYPWRLCLFKYPEGFRPAKLPRLEALRPRRV